jgi:hypothetical protein
MNGSSIRQEMDAWEDAGRSRMGEMQDMKEGVETQLEPSWGVMNERRNARGVAAP